LACLALATSSSGATVRGRVDVRLELKARAPRPAPNALGAGGPREVPDRRRSVVYLERAPLGAFEEGARGRVVMDQRGEAFLPYVLAVTVGTSVDFVNSDATYHNVFSLSKPKRFDLGRYARGRSKPVRFDRPGVVRVFCDIHSHMNAFILVFAHRFYSVTDEAGRYRIDDVPPGTYTIVVWSELAPQQSRPVTVPPSGGTVELNFALGRSGESRE
jgi:plastocyanin